MTVLLLVFLRVRSHGSSKKNIWNSDLIFEHVDASTCNSNYKPLTSYSQAGALQFVLCELLMLSLLDTIPHQYLISLLVFADYAVYIDCMDTIVFTCTFPGSSCFSWNKDLSDWIYFIIRWLLFGTQFFRDYNLRYWYKSIPCSNLDWLNSIIN